jgi:nitroreductase
MELQELERLIKERRTIRKWKRQDVSDDLIRRAIEVATWAPNGGNFQSWRFIAVKNREVIVSMANAVQSVADKIVSWPESLQWKGDMERFRANASFFRNAPVCIGVFVGQYISALDRPIMVRESYDQEARDILASRRSAPTAIQSAAAAAMALVLVFHQMGLGAAWLGAPLMAKREIEQILKVPGDLNLVCLVAVGYPDESPKKDRKPVDEVLEFVR